VLLEVGLEGRRGDPARDLEGPGERPPAECEPQALGGGVQVRTPAGCSSTRIGDDLEAGSPVTGDDSQ
jgi:hypothetical protein